MKNSITILTIFLLVSACYDLTYGQVTQEWVQRYDASDLTDYARSIAVDKSGNVYVTGYSQAGGTGYDYATIKYNSSGVQQWNQRYNGPGNGGDFAVSIAVDNLGYIYVTGYSRGSGTENDFATIKYDSLGNRLWVQRYDGPAHGIDQAYSIKVDNSGNVYITGESFNGSFFNYATIKYNSSGVQKWVKTYDGPGNDSDHPESMAVDKWGNVYVTGGSYGIGTAYDYATIKYDSTGTFRWAQRYNGPLDSTDVAFSITIDTLGNVYVTGYSYGIGSDVDYVTIKYNFLGAQEWVQRYNAPENGADIATSIAVDNTGNIYVTGVNGNISESDGDYATIKYSSSGVQQWVQRYNGTGNQRDAAESIVVDNSGHVYVTGYSYGIGSVWNYATIKYSSSGAEEWVQRYEGGIWNDWATSIAVDSSDNVYVTGASSGVVNDYDYATIKYSQTPSVIKPTAYSKWISGQKDTIKWTDAGWASHNIKCILNFGTPKENQISIAQNVVDTTYIWTLPDTLLSFRTIIIIQNSADTTQKGKSEVFRIKPYLLTRVKEDSTYYEFRKDRDRWGFWNTAPDIWPATWYSQFNYRGIDPFTGIQYSQTQGSSIFAHAKDSDHVDWISFVNTFTVSACYLSTTFSVYRPSALRRWKGTPWGGSCFGIAIANAMVFRNKDEFFTKYPSFPRFDPPDYPINVTSNNPVKKIINELFTHQLGQPHSTYRRVVGLRKTPNQTLNDIKAMLLSENDSVRTLSILNNPPEGKGGHAINVFRVTRDTVQPQKYYVYVYDNSHPGTNVPIIIDTSANGGNGSWSTTDWEDWGGNKWIYLRDPAMTYLTNPTFTGPNGEQSPFILDADQLQIFNPIDASITIKDQSSNVTGFFNNTIHDNIPNSFPLTIDNGSETPPYGYELPTNNYSVIMNNFADGDINAGFFTGNKSFSYERIGATPTQTDKLYFDGGVSVSNPDAQVKSIMLGNIINETTQEKVFSLSSLDLVQNDSVKIENYNIDNLKLTSYGSAKNYDIELNLAKSTGLGRYTNFNINLPLNSSHTFIPDWSNLANNPLVILEDLGNNGTIDDTLRMNSSKTLNLTALIEGLYNNITNKMIRDTVRVYLRDRFVPFAIIDSAKSVLDSTGKGTFNFNNAENGIRYYIVVKHKNSIETWGVTWQFGEGYFSSNIGTYNFTNNIRKAYGNNLVKKGGRYCIYSGDVNQDGIVDASDLSAVDNDAFYLISGYVNTDLNGDDFVDASDLSIVDNNSFNYVSVKRP